jgi:hypothetical protein
MNIYPDNHRAKWTDQESNFLYKEAKFKLDMAHIANTHKRTIGAIKFKLIRYAIDLSTNDNNLTLNDLSNITNLSNDVLIEGFKKLHYNFKNNYDTTNDKLSYCSIIYKDNKDNKEEKKENKTFPENHGLKWTNEETEQLYIETNKNMNFETIASNHKRTIESIKYKLFRNAVNLYLNDKNLSLIKLSKITNLPIDYLIDKFTILNIMPHYDNTDILNINKKTFISKLIKLIVLTSTIAVFYMAYRCE